MISVYHKQDLNSLLAESVEYNGEQLIDTLKRMGISQEEDVQLSIDAGDGKTVTTCPIKISEKSSRNNNDHLEINLENKVDEFLKLSEQKNSLLSELLKSESCTDRRIRMDLKVTFTSAKLRIEVTPVAWCCLNGHTIPC